MPFASIMCGVAVPDGAVIFSCIHVLEYLWKAAWSFFEPVDSDAETWIADTGTGSPPRTPLSCRAPGKTSMTTHANLPSTTPTSRAAGPPITSLGIRLLADLRRPSAGDEDLA